MQLLSMRRISLAAMLGMAVLLVIPVRAPAQNPYFQVRPGLTLQQFAFNLQTVGRAASTVPPYLFGFNPYVPFGQPVLSSYVNPYAGLYSSGGAGSGLYGNPYSSGSGYGGSGYGGSGYGGYYEDPFGAYLRGSGDVIKSQGQFMVSQQQAFVLREQQRQDALATRRKAFDEYLYEREKTPTQEEDRQRYLTQQLARSRNNPPVTEILSGKAMNDLLAALQHAAAQTDKSTLRTFSVPINEDDLRRINLFPVNNGTNVALLKNAGRLNWPVGLSGPEFSNERDRINTLMPDAVKQAEFNSQVDPGLTRTLREDASRLRTQLRRTGTNLPSNEYIDAKKFLDNLENAIVGLQQPDVGSYFTGKYAPKGKTVPDLITYMTQQGLQFAPAIAGEEASYLALYHALAAYENASRPLTAER